MIPQLLLIALATFASEDLTCIATGVLVAQGKLTFVEGVLACLAGIFVGDVLLFLTGRLAGARALRWPFLGRFLSTAMVQRAAEWLERKGLAVVFLSRFTPGLRLPTYFAAGMLRMPLPAFAIYFFVASAIWTPLAIGATALFGEELLRSTFAFRDQSALAFALVFGILILVLKIFSPLVRSSGRRRFIAMLQRAIRWEFWPAWVAYLPLVPYFLYLGVRHRSLTLFTLANPGIPSGGFAGESKSDILGHLSRAVGAVAGYALIPAGLDPLHRIRAAYNFMDQSSLDFPVVLKPDVGERGSGVAIIRSRSELDGYLQRAVGDTIIQRYVPGVEFGVFYCRYPHERRGRIFSITEKRFPMVTGDGKATLRDLIQRDRRATCIAATYEKLSRRPMDDVPAEGETVPLVEIGSHCRGALFLNGAHLTSRALEAAIDQLSRSHPGFYFGRFDVRSASVEAFQQGRFRVIELNGVSAEATHVYDPSVTLWEAYRVMFGQWRMAFEIGASNRAQGARPIGLPALLALLAGRASGRRVRDVPRNATLAKEAAR